MAAGDVVNTAARLQAAAPTNAILVDETTYRSTERAIDYREAAPVEAKGKAEPVPVWEALSARARVGVERVGGAQLVGREQELTLLRETLGARDPRARAAARDARRRTRHRQEPARLRALPDDRDRAPRARLLAPRPLTALRRGRDLLGARRDGEGAGRDPRVRQPRAGGREAPSRRSRASSTMPPAPHGWSAICARSQVSRRTRRGPSDRREEAFAAWRRFLEAIADERATRARLRGPALGRRRAARLRRLPRRLGERRAAARARHGSPRAPHPPAGLGRRQGQLLDASSSPRSPKRRRRRSCTPCSAAQPSTPSSRPGSSSTRAATRCTRRSSPGC